MPPVVDPAVEAYAERHTTPEPPHLVAVAEETRALTDAPQMMVGPLEGRLLAALVALHAPQVVLEIGTFTGYSALCMAPELPPGGRIVTCELSLHHAAIARRHFEASPWADRIELRVGPAARTLRTVEGPVDLVFIDADKTGYTGYLEAVLPLLSERGVVVVDNVLWDGAVVDPGDHPDPDTAALVGFNRRVAADERLEVVMLTVRDGLSLIRRRRT